MHALLFRDQHDVNILLIQALKDVAAGLRHLQQSAALPPLSGGAESCES
jgi:hypothetical protein